MAWDDYTVGNLELISGDIPFDALCGAVQRIRKSYLERFGRSPYLGELLYTLCRAVDTSPILVEDVTLTPIERVLSSLAVPTRADQIDPGAYEAGISEAGEVLITPRTTATGRPVVRVRVEDARQTEVVCRYAVLSPEISDAAARCLIRLRALHDLLDFDIVDPGLRVRFMKEPLGDASG
jgi:hypothetical protein